MQPNGSVRSGVCEKSILSAEEHGRAVYLLKIRRYGEDTDTVRSEGEDTVEATKIRSKIYGRCPIGRRRYGRIYEDTVEDTKIRSKIPRYGEDTVISQDLLMFRVRTPNLRTIPNEVSLHAD